MSVIKQLVGTPELLDTLAILWANSWAILKSAAKAPLPVLISITRASSPDASFLDKIEAVIKSIDSTVAVTSLVAYKRWSAGAKFAVCPIIAQPIFLTRD